MGSYITLTKRCYLSESIFFAERYRIIPHQKNNAGGVNAPAIVASGITDGFKATDMLAIPKIAEMAKRINAKMVFVCLLINTLKCRIDKNY